MNKILSAILLVAVLAFSVAGCQTEPQTPAGATAPPPTGTGFAKKPGGGKAELGSAQMKQGATEEEAASRIGSAAKTGN
jgi:hypothetical protein